MEETPNENAQHFFIIHTNTPLSKAPAKMWVLFVWKSIVGKGENYGIQF